MTDADKDPPSSLDSEGARGALAGGVLSSIINNNERVRAAFTSPDGLTRIGNEERHVAFSVIMLVTDERILFVEGDHSTGDIGADAGSLAYNDIAAVAVDGQDPAVLALSMANGVRWEFPLPGTDPEVIDSVRRHLHWVGELRSRLVACRNDIAFAAGEIRDHAKDMAWADAEAVYAKHRDRLDRLIGAVHVTVPIDDHVIAPELTDMERTLEWACAGLAIEYAQSQLELGQQLIENENYDQARKVLQTAQGQYGTASGRADAIERGDAFRFGEQRELRNELDRLEWEIEAVAAEPIRRAHEAKIMATNADSTADAVEHWETAFRRYGSVLTLEWGDSGRNFTGDPDEIRTEMRSAATELIDSHCELARELWDEGVTLERDDDVEDARRACTDAADHMDRAAGLAAEFRPGDTAAIERRRDGMRASLREMRDTATVETPVTEETAADTEPSASDGPGESKAEGLLDLDTHQEITFDATVTDGAADGGRRHEREFSATEPEEELEDVDDSGETDLSDSETVIHPEE
jgi:hypothetical protein